LGLPRQFHSCRPDQPAVLSGSGGQPQNLRGGFLGIERRGLSDGYTAFGAPDDKEDGTVSPTGAIASILLTPDMAQSQADLLYAKTGRQNLGTLWFSNTFNLDRNWYDPDVIGIDLGMMILNVENYRTGQIWKLIASHPATAVAWQRAGLHATTENEPRPFANRGV